MIKTYEDWENSLDQNYVRQLSPDAWDLTGSAFEAGQQARVPEGYVVVPVEINDEIESAMFSSVARGEMPCDIYKAMIEAVEK